MTDAAADQVKQVTENAQELAGKVADLAISYGEKVQDAARALKSL